MAVSVWSGLRPVRGSGVVVLLRLGLLTLAAVSAGLTARRGLVEAASRPHLTDVEGPLPVFHLIRFMDLFPTSWIPVTAACVVLVVLLNQWLNAGALGLLTPGRDPAGGSVAAVLRHHGGRNLVAFLLILVLSVALCGLGYVVVDATFERIHLAGERGGWTARALGLHLPALHVLCGTVWIALVGAWSLWCRLLTVHGDGRLHLATLWRVFPIWAREPLAGPFFCVAVTVGAQFAAGLVLIAWRQRAPEGAEFAFFWTAIWIATMLLHAGAWHWLLRGNLLVHDRQPMAGSGSAASAAVCRARG